MRSAGSRWAHAVPVHCSCPELPAPPPPSPLPDLRHLRRQSAAPALTACSSPFPPCLAGGLREDRQLCGGAGAAGQV
jgi:hypothetical protein